MTTATKRTRGVAAGLSREAVVAAAEKVAERNGFEGMSLRAVAVELGVSPTAIYHHVAGKDELIDAVGDAFTARVLDGPLPTDPVARVREMAHRSRRAGLEHPGLLSAVIGHVPAQFPSAHLTYAEVMLAALIAAGASEPTAHLLYGAVVRLCLGDVVSHANFHAPARVPLADRVRALTEQDDLPLTARMMADPDRSGVQAFDRMLDVVLQPLTP